MRFGITTPRPKFPSPKHNFALRDIWTKRWHYLSIIFHWKKDKRIYFFNTASQSRCIFWVHRPLQFHIWSVLGPYPFAPHLCHYFAHTNFSSACANCGKSVNVIPNMPRQFLREKVPTQYSNILSLQIVQIPVQKCPCNFRNSEKVPVQIFKFVKVIYCYFLLIFRVGETPLLFAVFHQNNLPLFLNFEILFMTL